jgi:hypothetical protein
MKAVRSFTRVHAIESAAYEVGGWRVVKSNADSSFSFLDPTTPLSAPLRYRSPTGEYRARIDRAVVTSVADHYLAGSPAVLHRRVGGYRRSVGPPRWRRCQMKTFSKLLIVVFVIAGASMATPSQASAQCAGCRASEPDGCAYEPFASMKGSCYRFSPARSADVRLCVRLPQRCQPGPRFSDERLPTALMPKWIVPETHRDAVACCVERTRSQ